MGPTLHHSTTPPLHQKRLPTNREEARESARALARIRTDPLPASQDLLKRESGIQFDPVYIEASE